MASSYYYWSVCVSVCVSVWEVYYGKTADWIQMPFGVVNGVGQETSVLNGVHMLQGEGEFWGIFHPLA